MPFTRNLTNFRNDATSSTDVSGISGILRKVSATNNANAVPSTAAIMPKEMRQVDLLVFGYACKVFRDDVKALEIDQGKHLIPWMGDSNLKIDRYDVRGAIYDLTPYEPPPGGYGNRLDYLSAEEQRAEQLCEEERYFFLYNNELDYITRQEEELKRLQQETHGPGYSQVQFSYDQPQLPADHETNCKANNSPSPSEQDNEQQQFQLPANFTVAEGIQLPETMKQHAIIEKTARFIATQGVQMEILIKAKQSNNAQFEFLAQNGQLNPYYKYILEAIKNGTYPEPVQAAQVPQQLPQETTEDANKTFDIETLNTATASTITMPTVRYKPSADCAYTQLISRIKGVSLPELQEENSRQSNAEQGDGGVNSPGPLPLPTDGKTQKSNDNQPEVEILKNSSALALAQNYSSDSEWEDDSKDNPKTEPKLEFPIPTENLKNIIDKTALYVIKNGRKFEETLLTKSEERFTFLLADNDYYPYYLYKITGDPNAASKEQKQRKAAAVAAALLSKKGITVDKNSSPVSFSIKTKDDVNGSNLQHQPVLPQDHSDDEETNQNSKITGAAGQQNHYVPEQVQKAIQFVESQLMARNAKLAAVSASLITPSPPTAVLIPKSSLSPTINTVAASQMLTTHRNEKLMISLAKLEAERNALYEQQQQNKHKEMKKAEEKVKDKLAQRAREKLGGLISKEKQLQLERKRKAMAFLNQIKSVSSNDESEKSLEQSNKMDDKTNEEMNEECNASDESETSVHSIPITSYGPDDNTDNEEKQQPEIEDIQINKTVSLNTNANNTRTSDVDGEKNLKKPTTITVSDDEDVELISEIKTCSRSRSRLRDYHPSQYIYEETSRKKHAKHYRKKDRSRSISNASTVSSPDRRRKRSSKSHSEHKMKKSKTKKSSKSKKKSKKYSRSRSRSHTPSTLPDSHHYHEHHYYDDECHDKSKHRSYTRSNSSEVSPTNTTTYHDKDNSKKSSYRKNKRSSHTPSRSAHIRQEYKRHKHN